MIFQLFSAYVLSIRVVYARFPDTHSTELGASEMLIDKKISWLYKFEKYLILLLGLYHI